MDNFQVLVLAVVLVVTIGYGIYRKVKNKTTSGEEVSPGEILAILIGSMYDKKELIETLLKVNEHTPEDIDYIISEVAKTIQWEVSESDDIDPVIRKIIADLPLDELLKIIGKLLDNMVKVSMNEMTIEKQATEIKMMTNKISETSDSVADENLGLDKEVKAMVDDSIEYGE